MSKSILETVHESAKELHVAGVMSEVTLRQFDALCLPPVKIYTPAQIKRIRQKIRTSQAVFAAYLNTSASTIQKWEIGGEKAQWSLLEIIEPRG